MVCRDNCRAKRRHRCLQHTLFAERHRMRFPSRFFSEQLGSRMTVPGTQGETLNGSEFVFLVQLNIVSGGIFCPLSPPIKFWI